MDKHCLICYTTCDDRLCDNCDKYYILDVKNQFIRKKKHILDHSNDIKDYNNETILNNNLCKIFGSKEVFRKVHPLWALGTKSVLLEYDIAIPKEKLLVEFDGEQHFKYPNYFHKTKKDFLEQKKRDKLKNKLAKTNDFRLIRFNYKDNIDIINVERKLKIC